MGSLDNLKKEAKRWLRAVRADDREAKLRLARAYPQAPADPSLRDLQHALAREHGHRDWKALAGSLTRSAPVRTASPPVADLAATFLEYACWDHRTHGKGDHRMYDHAAQRILAHQPAVGKHSFFTAVVSGDIGGVQRVLSDSPEAARQPGGSRGWTPILYLCFTRFTHPATIANAVSIARLLLDNGANPNDFYMAGDSEYSNLVGAAGEGEQDSPRQPYAAELYRLLLEREAGPYDIQVLYNTHFSGDMIWWLELTYQQSLATGRKGDWDDPHWSMLDMGGYGSGAHFVLNNAVQRNDLSLARWALTHGADPNSNTSAHPKFKMKRPLLDQASLLGFDEMAELLRSHGARGEGQPLDTGEAFVAACMRLDRAAVQGILGEHPEFLRSHRAMFEAATRDRPDVIAFLLELGVPLEIEDETHARALHHAAGANALRAAAFLIERGAEIDPVETGYGGTPIGWAAHGDRTEMMDFLGRHTRNVWTLTFRGYVDRLRQVLAAEPELARQVTADGITPLWWLPDDEAKAMESVEMLLAAGADPAHRSRQGRTAADWARKRGMLDIARRLAVDEDPAADPAGTEAGEAEALDPAQAGGLTPSIRPIVLPPPEPADVPVEMRTRFTMRLCDNSAVPTTEVWSMLTACRDGDRGRVEELVALYPSIVLSAYNYMPPLHLAVREGQLEIVRFLAARDAVNPNYKTYPYGETLPVIAGDRGYPEIEAVLHDHLRRANPDRREDEIGHIEYEVDYERRRFQRLVSAGAMAAVEELLERRPELATDPFAFWSEGVLSVPANNRNQPMIELLLRFGARVPEMSKWGMEYYFKHYEIGARLLEHGMSPNHMNCHRTTLLHEMARIGDVRKAQLLLEHGADIDAVDDEFKSTPLGFAVRWGRRSTVEFFLERGADPERAGAEWATPRAWAAKKGRRGIQNLLGP